MIRIRLPLHMKGFECRENFEKWWAHPDRVRLKKKIFGNHEVALTAWEACWELLNNYPTERTEDHESGA